MNDNGSASEQHLQRQCGSVHGCRQLCPDGTVTNLWHLTLTSPVAMTFDFFVANGNTGANTPLNLYVISTDSNPAVLGQ